MTKTVEKTEKAKTKQFSVIVDQKEILATSKRTEAISKVAGCQAELIPLIIMVDHHEKKAWRYKKTPHQRNHRIETGNYETDSVTKSGTVEETKPEEVKG